MEEEEGKGKNKFYREREEKIQETKTEKNTPARLAQLKICLMTETFRGIKHAHTAGILFPEKLAASAERERHASMEYCISAVLPHGAAVITLE